MIQRRFAEPRQCFIGAIPNSCTTMNWARKAIAGVILSLALLTPIVTAAVLLTVYKNAGRNPTTTPTRPSPKSAAPAGGLNESAGNLKIIRNADGTFTIQTEPPSGGSKDSKGGSGLMIPPQVVTPLIPATGKKASGRGVSPHRPGIPGNPPRPQAPRRPMAAT